MYTNQRAYVCLKQRLQLVSLHNFILQIRLLYGLKLYLHVLFRIDSVIVINAILDSRSVLIV